MTEKEALKQALEEELEKVKFRQQILDLIEERLQQMKVLALRVVNEDLTQEERQKIQLEVNHLEEQVRLLDCENKQFS